MVVCHFLFILSFLLARSVSSLWLRLMHFYCIYICISSILMARVSLLSISFSLCVCMPRTIKCKCEWCAAFKIYFHRNDNYNKQTINSCCWLKQKKKRRKKKNVMIKRWKDEESCLMIAIIICWQSRAIIEQNETATGPGVYACAL